MQALQGSPTSNLLLLRVSNSHLASHRNRSPNFFISSRTLIYSPTLLFTLRSTPEPSRFDSSLPDDEDSDESGSLDSSFDPDPEFISDDGVVIEVEKVGRNSRRIRSRIAISASLQTIWNLLTDYEKLADFIPGLAVSQLLEKRDNFARLFQIGQQNLAFGLKFNAKGIVDCYEKDLEKLPFGQRRDIEFKMIEGDFQIFEGKWSIEQTQAERVGISSSVDEDFRTTLHYVVDVEPKLWLPVGLVEGRICREIVTNLSCIREESEKRVHNTIPNC